MARVSRLTIEPQNGSDNTLVGTWSFDPPSPSSSSGGGGGGGSSSSIRSGSRVRIKNGARWYNGVRISSWVFNYTWIVYQIRGSRVVLDRNTSNNNRIMSAIHINNLRKV